MYSRATFHLIAAVAFVASAAPLSAQDFGDAPAPYPTIEHTTSTFERFGATVINPDFTNPMFPPWIGSPDDDGLTFNNMVKGDTAQIDVDVQGWWSTDDIAVWIDWNDDGFWDPIAERVIWAGVSATAPDGPIGNGVFNFTVAVPPTAVGATAKVRARIWDTAAFGAMPNGGLDGGGDPSGDTDWGEVEDYEIPYVVPGDPEIAVQRPLGTTVVDGGTDNVGPLQPSVVTQVTWNVLNQGAANPLNLTGMPLVAISAQVNVTAMVSTPPATPVAPAGSTPFVIDITPTAVGAFSFNVSIDNDDADENPYNFTVTGKGGMGGAYLVSNDPGEAPDFADPGAAFDALEAGGVYAAVVLNVSAGTGPYASNAAYSLGTDATGVALAVVEGVSAVNTIAIQAQAGEVPVVNGAGMVDPNGLFFATMIIATAYVTVESLEFSGGTDGGLAIWHNTPAVGIVGGNCTVDRVIAHGYTTGAGIAVVGDGAAINNVTVKNCFVYDCAATGTPFAANIPGAITIFFPGANVVLRHNTVVLNSGFDADAAAFGAVVAPVSEFYDNIAVATSIGGAIAFAAGVEPLAADYNVYFFTGPAVFNTDTVTYPNFAAWQAVGSDFNGQQADPLLVNVTLGSEDLHLTAASPAVNAAALSTETRDVDGAARPGSPTNDIGAHEFGGVINNPPTAVLSAGSFFSGNAVTGFDLVIGAGATLSNANLDLVDAEDAIDLNSVTPAPGPIAGVTAPAAPQLALASGTTISWTGTVGIAVTPGVYTYTVGIDDNTNPPVTFDVRITVTPNAPPVAILAIPSSFTGNVIAGFDLTVSTGATLANANLDLIDGEGGPIDLNSVIPAPGPIAGVTAPAAPQLGLASGTTIGWTGTVGGAVTPGIYTYTLNIDDNINPPVTFDVRISVVNTPPSAMLAVGSSFTGNAMTGFNRTIVAGGILSNANLDLVDAQDAINLNSITPAPGPVTGVTAPAAPQLGLASGTTISWSGTVDAAVTPGVYTYTVNIDDGVNPAVNFDVRITVVAPGSIESNCGDGIDNDGDGAIDCADSDCSVDPVCAGGGGGGAAAPVQRTGGRSGRGPGGSFYCSASGTRGRLPIGPLGIPLLGALILCRWLRRR